jgi:TolB protein
VLGAGFVASAGASNGARVEPGWLLFEDNQDYRSSALATNLPGLYLIRADGRDRRPLRGKFYFGGVPDRSPDGRTIVFSRWLSREDDRAGRFGQDLIVADSDGRAPRLLVKHTEALPFPTSPEWSPNGRQIVFADSGFNVGNELFIVDLATKKRRALVKWTTAAAASSPSWSPDGRSIAFSADHLDSLHPDSDVSRIAPSGGTAETLVRHATRPAWSPNGREIAYLSTKGGIYTLDLASRQKRFVTPSCTAASAPEWSPDGRWLAFADCAHRGRAIFEPEALIVVRANGSGRRVIFDQGARLRSPDWH